MGENLVLQALGFPQAGGRIVTDALHFFGSFYTYGELGKAGVDVVTLPMTAEGDIDMDQLEAAVNDNTKLVAISLVSTVNGFEHDLKRVCDLAHAHGAYVYVYADIVHAAGSTPTNLRAAGVDFAASSSYKWLMGDFGLDRRGPTRSHPDPNQPTGRGEHPGRAPAVGRRVANRASPPGL